MWTDELAEQLDRGHNALQMMAEDCWYQKVSVNWVTHQVTPDLKEGKVDNCSGF